MAAPWAYVDSSTLLKRYLAEPGTTVARRLLRRYRVVSSAVAPVEATSALCRRRAAGDIDEYDFRAIVRRLAHDRAHWELLDLTAEVLNGAERVIHNTRVRTLDAIHLASALLLQAENRAGEPTPFLTGDARQRDAATQLGLRALWVGG